MMEFHPYSRNLPREDGVLFRPRAPVATTQPPPLYTIPPSSAYGPAYGESDRYPQPQLQPRQLPQQAQLHQLHQQQHQQPQPQLQPQPQQQLQQHPQPQIQQLQQQQQQQQSPVTPFPGPYRFPPVNHGSVHPTQRHSRSHSSPNQARLQRIGFRDHPSASPTMSHPQRQMPPPPSPPQHYPSRSQSTNPPALSNPVFARDHHHHNHQQQQQSGIPAHRPGSSMSISAMLGSDADRPSREVGPASLFSRTPVASSPSPFGSAPPATATPGGMSPPTGPARPSSLDYPLFRRSQTPEKSLSRNQHPAPRPYRSSSGGVSHASLTGPLSSRAPPPPSSSQFPEKPSPPISSAETAYNEPRRLSLNGSIPRPSSQPLQMEQPRPSGYSPLSRAAPAPAPEDTAPFGAAQQHRPSYLEHGRYNYPDRQLEDQREKERMEARYAYGERRHPSAGAWDLNRSQPSSPESKRFPAPESGPGFGFGAIQSYTKSLGSQPGGSRPPSLESAQQSRPEQSTFPPSGEQGSYILKQQPESSRLLGSGPSTTGPALYSDEKRKGSDELMHHRNLLGVGAEKRGGRLSPLPQAVQGALGPGGESTIKNDLGRVFSGIGSGVGGVTAPTAGSGHSTPLAVSPFKRDSGMARSANGDTTDEARNIIRPGSTMGKRSRKSQEDLQFLDNDIDQRTGMSRGRRARPHHHHHHHHHHHRSKEEEAAAALGSRPPFFQRASTVSAENGNMAAHHHHHHPHHHHHHHHHHRHTSRTSGSVPAEPMREPHTMVNIEPVRSSVAHLPRHHLGSTLYAPRIGMPATHASMESAKFGYTSTPQPLPRFEGKANCTFTVRVPRYRVDAVRREEVCARRALWGTGIYTDDSDPVAAAIHSGYMRGSWGDDVDESILDLEIKDTYQHAPPPSAEERDSDQPRLPPVPPRDKDAHITLLILPKLEQYDSSVLFGIKSRTWDSSHDGMSFQILSVDWVDEGAGRGEERGGEARRKRLRNLMQSGRICTGPASIKIEDLRQGHTKPVMASAQPV